MAMAAVNAISTCKTWWVFLILAIVQGIGLLAMLALVRRAPVRRSAIALGTGARVRC